MPIYRPRKRNDRKGKSALVSRCAITTYLNSLDINYTSENNISCISSRVRPGRRYLLAGFASRVSFFSLAFIPDLSPSSQPSAVSFCHCILSFIFFSIEYYKLLIVSKRAACWAALSFR